MVVKPVTSNQQPAQGHGVKGGPASLGYRKKVSFPTRSLLLPMIHSMIGERRDQ